MRPSSARWIAALSLAAAFLAFAASIAPTARSAPARQAPTATDEPTLEPTAEITPTEEFTPTVEIPTETPTSEFTLPPPPPPITPTPMPTDDDEGDDDDEGQNKPQSGACQGSVMGLVFVDSDQDGKLGAHEPGYGGVKVEIEGKGPDQKQTSSATGQFSFGGVAKGGYDVSVKAPDGWRVTTPDRYHLNSDCDTVQGIDFGLTRGTAKAAAMRLPRTGVADLPRAGLLGAVALVLGMVALVGFGWERRRTRS